MKNGLLAVSGALLAISAVGYIASSINAGDQHHTLEACIKLAQGTPYAQRDFKLFCREYMPLFRDGTLTQKQAD